MHLFNGKPLLIRAPGRINLIGEHTDYNNGYVLPAAIDKHILFAVRPNNRAVYRFVANDLNDKLELNQIGIQPHQKRWANYLLGVIAQLNQNGIQIPGVDCVFGGDVPLGAGLSSSAALETGFVFALNELFNLSLDRREMVMLSQKAEHEYAGVKCGIMDQFASLYGEKNRAIQLDCRSLEYKTFPLELPAHDIILCDTGVKHSLASSEYNDRRQECERGVSLLKTYNPQVESLRDISKAELFAHQAEFDPVIFKRCRFVVEENQRVLDACAALESKQLKIFGDMMYRTHAGLRDEYQVSCEELDLLVEIAREGGVIGSRMMGGGFGGCTINIVEKTAANAFIETAAEGYKTKTGMDLKTYTVSIEAGTHVSDDKIF